MTFIIIINITVIIIINNINIIALKAYPSLCVMRKNALSTSHWCNMMKKQ